MSRPRRPTILDVARHAGVSKSTVSAALRGERGVAAETVERVHAAVAAIGYRPLRQRLSGREQLIGLAVRHLDNPYFSEMTAELGRQIAAEGLRAVATFGQRSDDAFARQFQILLDLPVDAMIVVSGAPPLGPLTAASADVPVVVLGRSAFEVEGVDSLTSDNRIGAMLAVEHLTGLGHRRIAFVTASQRPTAIERYSGYRASMRAAGLDPVLLHQEDGADVVADIRRLGVTATFANNDDTAIQLLTNAMDAGLPVPRELSVVGYDGASFGARMRPRLTSVAQPRPDTARRVLALTMERLQGRTSTVQEVIEPALVVGETTAAAPASRGRSDARR